MVQYVVEGTSIMNNEFEELNSIPGILSDSLIKKYIKNKEIIIYPLEEKNLTPVGYNLTATDFILSVNNQLLVPLYFSDTEKYCYVEPHDTVLIMTREAIKVSNTIAGTFHSRVSIVSKGFGHISTTLDPFWQGPLLISLNNPTKKRLKLTLGKIVEEKVVDKSSWSRLRIKRTNNEKLEKLEKVNKTNKVFVHQAFVTMVLRRLPEEPFEKHDNPSGRFDLLKSIVDTPPTRRMFWPWKKNKNHYKKLKQLIDQIGSLTFLTNSKEEKIKEEIESEKELFIRNYERFFKTLEFYTHLAREATDEIIDRKKWRKISLTIIGFFVLVGIFILVWRWSSGATVAPTIAYFALIVASIQLILSWFNTFRKKG